MLNFCEKFKFLLLGIIASAIVFGIYYFNTHGITHGGNRHIALEKLAEINLALNLYKKDYGLCPDPKDGWQSIIKEYNLSENLKTDPWGNNFSYITSKDRLKCELYSFGENGIDEKKKGDDLASQSEIM